MSFKKNSWHIGWVSALIILLWLLLRKEFSWIQFSNLLFLWSLPFLIIGGFLWVFASGSFDHFQASMKKAFSVQKTEFLKLSEIGRQSYVFWLQPGFFLLLLSLLCLIFNKF